MSSRQGRSGFARLGLAALVSWSSFPIILLIMSSFGVADSSLVSRATKGVTADNYVRLFVEWGEFTRALGNSALVAGATVVIALSAATAAAYVLSRSRGRQRNLLKRLSVGLIVTRMLPPIVITIPIFPLLRNTGLFDTTFALVVVYSALYVTLGVFLMKSFLDAIPVELEEAALLDGCTRFEAFRKVTLPLVRGGLVATGVFIGLDAWNEYLFALTFTSNNARTAPLVIGEMLGAVYEVDWGAVLAASTIQLAPALALIWAVQRRLIGGMTMGALKG